jgi:hypothetical protein
MGTYYRNIEKFIDTIDNGNWIEIGVDRGEGSTKFFADLCKNRGIDFYGVDVDADQITRATSNLTVDGVLPNHIKLAHAKGEDFLRDLDTTVKISLAYLDNFDWDYWLGGAEEAFVAGVKQKYRDLMKIEMTNLSSQQTHLLQSILLMDHMTDNSIIVCDDTWYHPHEGIFVGKCSAAIPFLMLHGYRHLHNDGYRQNSGAIFGRFK